MAIKALRIETPRIFSPLLDHHRYKGAYGGRGGGKSHFFAEHLVEWHVMNRGIRSACLREVQKTLQQSVKLLIEDKLRKLGLGEADGFKVFREVIQTPGDGIIIFRGMQDYNADSIKSLEDFSIAWVEEAQAFSARSLMLLRPTIRTAVSELWFSWNPRRPNDPVDEMFRFDSPPTDSALVRVNWNDNPKFPDVLNQERLDCLKQRPEIYDNIWEGGYEKVFDGAYYARDLILARQENRIGIVSGDPLLSYRAFIDIGGTGARADAFSMWIAQFIGTQIRVVDYYEAIGQPLSAHLDWMRSRGYTHDNTQFWLPHDGATNDKVYNVSYESSLRQAGFDTTVVPNQGKGAAKARIEATRRIFPNIWFNEDTVDSGLSALSWYHERKDEYRNIGLGPEHDWSSHASDAFGLMAIVYEKTQQPKKAKRPVVLMPTVNRWG